MQPQHHIVSNTIVSINKEVEIYVTDKLPQKPYHSNLQNQNTTTENKHKIKAEKAFKLSKEAGFLTLPVLTGLGLTMLQSLFSNNKSGMQGGIDTAIGMAGVPMTIGGFVIDVIKAPVTGSIAIGAFGYALLQKSLSWFTSTNTDENQINEITESFQQRFLSTIQILIALKIETEESITEKFEQLKNSNPNGFMTLVAITILNSAYASRCCGKDTILLANGNILHKKHCPQSGIEIFNMIVELRNFLCDLDYNTKTNKETMPMIIKWLPIIKQALEDDSMEIEFSDESYDNLNKCIYLLKKISKKIIKLKSITKNEDKLQDLSSDKIRKIPYKIIATRKPYEVTSISTTTNSSNQEAVVPILYDYENKNIINDAVVGSNGYLYNKLSAIDLQKKNKISRFIKLYSAGGPMNPDKNSSELKIDPITCEEIKQTVIANDGRIYDLTTVLRLIQNKQIGMGGSIITDYIICDPKKW